MRNMIRRAGWLALAAVLCSCAVSGPPFSPVTDVSPDESVVYIYRLPSARGGTAEWPLLANGEPLTIIKNGGYYPYVTQPGSITFSIGPQNATFGYVLQAMTSDAMDLYTLDAQRGESHYLYFKWPPDGFGGYPELYEVPSEEGAAKITETKRLENFQAD